MQYMNCIGQTDNERDMTNAMVKCINTKSNLQPNNKYEKLTATSPVAELVSRSQRQRVQYLCLHAVRTYVCTFAHAHTLRVLGRYSLGASPFTKRGRL